MQPVYPFLLTLLFCISCGLDEPDPKEQLPPATQEGKNTFGCLVNGEVWVPKRVANKLEFSFSQNEGAFSVTAYRKVNDKTNQELGIGVLKELKMEGSYLLNNLATSKTLATFNDYILKCYYETSSEQSGVLQVTKLDTINHIIAGTFAFTVWTDECDTIRVTDGRFDVNYFGSTP